MTHQPVMETITKRRSIRRFAAESINREQIETILEAGRQAPSGKNKQPWRFVVIESSEAKEQLYEVMQKGNDAFAERFGEANLGSARGTLRAMRESGFTVLVVSPDIPHPIANEGSEEKPMQIGDIVDLQSIGAAIQNMILAAWEMGIGSLWICDTFFSYPDLVSHYQLEGLLVAAVSFGIAAEEPAARPRKPMQEIVSWL